jgi:hypothetical protein
VAVNYKLEIEAYKRLSDTLQELEQIRALFEQARSPIPDVLLRLSRSSNGHGTSPQQGVIAETEPTRPTDIDPDWIWLSVKDAGIHTLALAIVRSSSGLLTTREIHSMVTPYNQEVPIGTIANVATRAEANQTIVRDDAGRWGIVQPEKIGVLHGEYIWGPASIFQVQEVAAYRRFFIIDFLRKNPVGMLQSQILAYLLTLELTSKGVPVNKSLVKADLETMDGNKVRRRGGSKKWEAIA